MAQSSEHEHEQAQDQSVDVLICGSGSAGLCAALWLAIYGVSSVKILERRSGPMTMGQADGVQCRTVEVFESFGMSEDLLREAYHVLEVAFWAVNPNDPTGKLYRTSRTADTQPGLSHQPHVILNQARINGLMLDKMRGIGARDVEYGYTVKSVAVDNGVDAAADYPCTVIAEKNGKEERFRAKYVLGCDGAHSMVRKSLGYKMVGDTTDAVWGVMDVYPRTNFPDIRRKATIHSNAGTILVIPREGGWMVRFYIEFPTGTNVQDVELEDLHEKARQVFSPFEMEIAETAWWSCYCIGQRLADHFTKDNRIFLTGDAFHTHSPKAGQGMNVSLQDGYNIGWKLGMILTGKALPSLLTTYNLERGKTAADLIDFDRWFTKLFSKKKSDASSSSDWTPEHFSEGFIKSGRYTAGLTAKYEDSPLTSSARSRHELAQGVVVGMRFPNAQVVRFCDAKAMPLVRALTADGRWRVIFFAGKIGDPNTLERLHKIAEYLDSPTGPVRKYTAPTADIDSFIEPIVVFSGERIKLEQEDIPAFFWPVTGKWKARDLHKAFVDDESYNSGHGHAYEKYGVDPDVGATVIVRPDQYVSKVIPIDDTEGIGELFDSFVVPQVQNGAQSLPESGTQQWVKV
ncbi:FAD-dependent monooxygenase terD [Exophiala dermatitidis]|uniref:Phenol 2-monooxygenase n=1 Tax=Exophiala dermatitidis (strain ATCC 34100 / CBS 525.76 / NIH/UT8656) TaxID=858893 RepID=H6C932_EXODN|nr:phenol 2-monooxygenase [Exophiala dermatitidis NIH/UT8656]EHY60609.1 phenol 2-monooxygenase [Exophiala dermatitidis NIH/UT8656]